MLMRPVVSHLMANYRNLAAVLLFLTGVLAQTPTQFVVRTSPVVATAGLREAVAADFDGDGDLDLCGGTGLLSPTKQAYLRNDGQERFTALSGGLPASNATTLATVALDYDNDGDIDLFVSKQQSPSMLWNNNGAGVFTDASANLPPLANDHLSAAAADFDGDGDVDIALMQGYFGTNPGQQRVGCVHDHAGRAGAVDDLDGGR